MGSFFIAALILGSPVWEYRAPLMGGEIHIQIQNSSGALQVKAYKTVLPVIEELETLEREISPWISDSSLSRWNRLKVGEWIQFSPTAFKIIQNALKWAQKSGGAFDPTYLSIGQLWNFSGDSFAVPSQKQVESKLSLVDYRAVQLSPQFRRVLKKEEGLQLGLGGVAKGRAVDLLVAALRKASFENFSIQFGGELYVAGEPGSPVQRIGIRHPRQLNAILGHIKVQDSALASSGDYERYFLHGGVRYHHILDPKTGYPARLCQGVSILAPTSEAADALATAVFVLGPKKGLVLIESVSEVEGIIVGADGKLVISSGMVDKFIPRSP